MAKKDTSGKANGDLGTGELKSAIDEATSQGFRGVKVDPTPNENYTVAGVTSGAPRPETDADLQEEAIKRSGTGSTQLRDQQAANAATLEAAAANGLDTSSREESEGGSTGEPGAAGQDDPDGDDGDDPDK